ncbi:VanZ family protein [Bergeriella denitrificans]|uniref:VanZ family protein n=1 Tax=Bergeriella denitrificans TaxID=494 RepID=A0A378UET6_BERDE|nr:VanZ family protein [Bergeriella denitrificans]STZ75904.1 VanZ family protein [Bergeriella denitrificans]
MPIPRNRFTLLALLWLAAGIYSLLFREAGGGVPPFPHFDKVAHFALFFAQFWLCAKAFIREKRAIPYRGLLLCALVYALLSEWAQAAFTATRQGSWGDGAADMAGAAAALWLAHRVNAAKNNQLIQ